MKLSVWAKREGMPLRTAQRKHSKGELPVPTFTTNTGRRMVIVEEPEPTLSPEEMTEMLFALREQLNRIEQKLDACLPGT
jgi:hypothetical protein